MSIEHGIPEHKDPEVQRALVRLLDALCTWERATGRENAFILREDDYCCRAQNGKCVVPVDIPDEAVFAFVRG